MDWIFGQHHAQRTQQGYERKKKEERGHENQKRTSEKNVMLSLSKHLYRFVASIKLYTVEMLGQAQHNDQMGMRYASCVRSLSACSDVSWMPRFERLSGVTGSTSRSLP